MLAWVLAMSIYGASVVTDARTTQIALQRGASEANPVYSWMPKDQIPAARLLVGGGAGWAFNRVHRYHPRGAWAMISGFTILNAITSRHNVSVGIAMRW